MTRRAARPSALPPIALIGTYVPRACGIATFTRDLRDALVDAGPPAADASPYVVALDHGGALDPRRYPPEVAFRLPRGKPAALEFVRAGLDDKGVGLVSLQHEFGIYGGRTGREVLGIAAALSAPIVTTFHTVLEHPRPSQREVMSRLAAASARVVVMTDRGRALLTGVYGVPRSQVAVIPHGVPDLPFADPNLAKPALDLARRRVILSFGLLSPNKGLELAIDALAGVVDAVPEVMLVIAGRTHPEVRHRHGEAYRRGLVARIAGLGLTDHVRFVNKFLEPDELAAMLAATDVFVTPYGDAAQITSGTLAYAVAAGAAVVSTPYEHALELLADGRGVLVPFGDAAALGAAFSRLLTDDDARDAMRRLAWAYGRSMVWPAVGAAHRALFREVLAERSAATVQLASTTKDRAVEAPPPEAGIAVPRRRPTAPETPGVTRAGTLAPLAPVARRHLERLWTPIGLYQHAVNMDPDPAHGYCTDDVARALVVEMEQGRATAGRGPATGVRRSLDFLEEAFAPATGRFRNFRGVDGRWLELVGSEDSHGRAIQALGALLADPPDSRLVVPARHLLALAIPAARHLDALRPRAYVVLGCSDALAAGPDPAVRETLAGLAAGLAEVVASAPAHVGWPWPEPVVTYDNGAIPAALIAAGLRLNHRDWVEQGCALLAWLAGPQTSPDGHLTPIGNQGWWPIGGEPARFDQQPLEAAGLLEAARLAYAATHQRRWVTLMERCYAWFLGANDLGVVLADPEDGSCRDGLRRDGANPNRGAESTLAWLLAAERIRTLRAAAATLATGGATWASGGATWAPPPNAEPTSVRATPDVQPGMSMALMSARSSDT